MTLKPLHLTDHERDMIADMKRAMPPLDDDIDSFTEEDQALQDRDDLNIAVEEHYEAYLEQRSER